MEKRNRKKKVVAYLCGPYRTDDPNISAGALATTLRKTCEERGWLFEGTFIDAVGPGRNERPSLHRLMEVAGRRPKPFDAVFVAEPGELSGDMLVVSEIHAALNERGIELIFGEHDVPDAVWTDPRLRALRKRFGPPDTFNS